MEIIRNVNNWPTQLSAGSVALGFFDGVHLGHQRVINSAIREAKQRLLPSVVLSFAAHPLSLINPAAAPKLIMPLEEKINLIGQLGVDYLLLLPVTSSLITTEAYDFASMVLAKVLKTKHIAVGYNYSFGYQRQGTAEKLSDWGRTLGFEVSVISPVTYDGQIISSSRIRKLISSGEVEKAAALLGRWPTISGQVVHGTGRGRLFGFPTANICIDSGLLTPRFGVYAVRSLYEGKYVLGAANMGLAPTCGCNPARFEVNLFDFNHDLYGEHLQVELISFLRPERKFRSTAELKNQMKTDKEKALRILAYADQPQFFLT